jgi:hypothetical protein
MVVVIHEAVAMAYPVISVVDALKGVEKGLAVTVVL